MKGHSVSTKNDGERGMIVILMAVAIVGLIGAGSLAVDIGSALVTKTELQNVADASTLAATRELAMIYRGLDPKTNYKEYELTDEDQTRIRNKALAFAAANKAGGLSITLGNSDVVPSKYDIKTGETTPSNKGVRAIKVTGRRDDTQNGQIQTTLGRVLGIDQIAITADSASAISNVGKLKAGYGEFPIGLDEAWFETHYCDSTEIIKIYPTSEGACAGWHSFTDPDSSAGNMKKIVDGLISGQFKSPETIAGQTYYNFNGGTIESVVKRLVVLFNSKGGPGWTVNVPVYKHFACGNPMQEQLIVGFAKVRLQEVRDMPSAKITGEVVCGVIDGDAAEGGGDGDFGMLVSSPGML